MAPLNQSDDKKEQSKSLINRFGVLDGANKPPAKKFLMIGGAGVMSSMKEQVPIEKEDSKKKGGKRDKSGNSGNKKGSKDEENCRVF